MEEKLKQEIMELLRDIQSQDSIELGDSKGRIKVYVNFANEKQAEDKISKAIKILNEKRTEALQ